MRRIVLAGLLLFLCGAAGFTQPYFSRDRSFTVSEIRGCRPLTITINVIPDQANGTCASFAYRPFGTSADTRNSPVGSCTVTVTYDVAITQTTEFTLQLFTGGVGANNDDEIKITLDPNLKPDFDIYSCDNQKAQVLIKDKLYDQYFVDFNFNSGSTQTVNAGISPTAQFTYSTAGIKTIGVRGKKSNGANNCDILTKNFNAVIALPDATIQTLNILDAATLELSFTPTEQTRYRAEIAINNTTTFQTIKEFYSATGSSIAGKFSEPEIRLNTNDNFYCLRLRKFDPCTNSSQVISSTPLICSTNLKVTPESGKNQLSWTPSQTGISGFSVQRNATQDFATTNLNALEDSNVECTKEYCYTVTASWAGGAKSISAKKCVTAFSSQIPDAVSDISSVVDDKTASLTWLRPPDFIPDLFSVRRARGDLNFLTLSEITDTTFRDLSYGEKAFTAYQIAYTDQCGNKSPASTPFRPVDLEGIVNTDNSIQLYWNSYKGYASGVTAYEVNKLDLNNVLLQTFTVSDTFLLDNGPDQLNQLVRYRVTAIPASALPEKSLSRTAEFIRQPRLIFPTAFTPDGKGPTQNEGFKIIGQYIDKIRLQIFDRWGKLLFTTTDLNVEWDGKSGTTDLPQSSYVWRAEITDLLGRAYTRSGSVALLRN